MTIDELNQALDEGFELSEEQLEEVVGGASGVKTKKLVCNACGYSVDATAGGIQTMAKHCSTKHKNATYRVE